MSNLEKILLSIFLSPIIFGVSLILLIKFEFGSSPTLYGLIISLLPILWALFGIINAPPKVPDVNDSYDAKEKMKDGGYFLTLLIAFSLLALIDTIIGYVVWGYYLFNHFSAG